jgi:cobalamin biosynthesis protein CobD/CbiB
MWGPARVTAVLLSLTAFNPSLLRTAKQWQSAVESPNAGWPMSVIAAHLQVQLRKPGEYAINQSTELPSSNAVLSGISYVRICGLITFGFAGGLTWF